MAQKLFEKQGADNIKIWTDPELLERSVLEDDITFFTALLALDDRIKEMMFAGMGLSSVESFDAVIQDELDQRQDQLDALDYDTIVHNMTLYDGEWYSPEAVEAHCGEETGNEAVLAIDGSTTTFWQHNTDEAHQIDFRLRSYWKKVTKIRIRRQTNVRSALNNLDVYFSRTLNELDDASNLVATGITISTDNDWNEIEFSASKRGSYLRLTGFGSAHAGNEIRIREVEVRVVPKDYL